MIYLDNAATTKPHEYLLDEFSNYLSNKWANPSSLHKLGVESKKYLENSRKSILKKLNLVNSSIIFTPSATVGLNSVLETYKSDEIVSGIWEHPAVYKKLNNIGKQNNKLKFLDFKEFYKNQNQDLDEIIIEKFINNISTTTKLVSCMWVHNETGYIFPIEKLANEIKKVNPDIKFLCDGTQGVMKIPLTNTFFDNIDYFVVSSHKFHSIRGAGFILKKNTANLKTFLYGGGQEEGIISSTENNFAIKAMSLVIEKEFDNISKTYEKIKELKQYLNNKIEKNNLIYNMSKTNKFSPYISKIFVKNTQAEVLLNHLSANEVCVSSGSACSSKKKKKITDNTIFAIPNNYIKGSIRISFSSENTKSEIDEFIDYLDEGIKFFL